MQFLESLMNGICLMASAEVPHRVFIGCFNTKIDGSRAADSWVKTVDSISIARKQSAPSSVFHDLVFAEALAHLRQGSHLDKLAQALFVFRCMIKRTCEAHTLDALCIDTV